MANSAVRPKGSSTQPGSEPAERNTEAFLGVKRRQSEDQTSKQLANKKIKKRTSVLDQFAIPMNCFNLVTVNYLFRSSFKWTINGFEAIVALPVKTFEMSSQVFQWNGYPVRAQANLQLKEDGCFYLSLRLNDDSQLNELQPIPQVFYSLKNQNGGHTKRMCRSRAYLAGSPFCCSLQWDLGFVHKSWFQCSTGDSNNSVEIEVYVEPSAMTQRVHPHDGTLQWTIENYAERLRLERQRSVYFQESPYFYTGPNGYRVQARLKLNGIGGGGPTVVVSFVTGKFDAQLPKPFPHSTTVTLVNREDPEKSVKKSVVKDIQNEIEYTIEICSFKEVKSLVQNDALFCKVVVKSRK